MLVQVSADKKGFKSCQNGIKLSKISDGNILCWSRWVQKKGFKKMSEGIKLSNIVDTNMFVSAGEFRKRV